MKKVLGDFLRKSESIILIVISSILLFISTPGFSLWPLAFAALIPFFIALKKAPGPGTSALYGFIFGLLFYFQLLYWLAPTMRAGGVSMPLAILCLAALSALLSLEFILTAWLSFYFRKLGCLPWALMTASIWTLCDFLKLQANKIAAWFPWFSMAITQSPEPRFLRWAFYGGIYGFSFLMIFFQASIAHSLKDFRLSAFKAIAYAGFLSALFFTPAGNSHQTSQEEKLRIALLQPSIELYKKWDSVYASEIKNTLENLALSASEQKPDLIVWPENALPGWIDDREISAWLSSLAKKTGAFHMVGSLSKLDARHVAVFLISPEGEIKAEYDKRELVPFGEYVPMRDFLGKYVKALGAMGEFEEGPREQPLMEVKGFKIGPSICYESVFDYLFREQAGRGADIFVNVTNDGWYFDTFMPLQHLAEAKLRAAENAVYLARAANNGICAFIGSSGEIISSTKLNEKTFLIADIKKQTPMKRSVPEYFFVYLSLIIFVSFLTARIFI